MKSKNEKSNFTEPPKSSLLGAKMSGGELQTHLQLITDELAVRDLTARFSDACNTRNIEAFRRLWLADGVWEIGEPLPARAEGIEKIVKMLENLLNAWEFFVQMTHTGIVRISGDMATARWTVQETARQPKATGFYNNFALYEDKLVRVEGNWYFAERRYEYIYLDDAALHGKSFAPASELDI